MYRKALVCFMEEKAKEISRRTRLQEELYFNEADKKVLLQWDPGRAKQVWEWIGDTLYRRDYNAATLCPFCQMYMCSECPYAEHHVRCSSSESDFSRVVRALGREFVNIFTAEEWIAVFEDCSKRAGLKEVEVMFYASQ